MITQHGMMNGEELRISCPRCGSEYCHHENVEVFERLEGEDGPSYSMEPGRTERILRDDNPSLRRNAVRIHFWCEDGCKFYMDLIQHKGMTYINCGGRFE
jgi:hypothetical protein